MSPFFLVICFFFFSQQEVRSWTLPIHFTALLFFPGSARIFLYVLNLLISNSWWIVIPFGKLKLQKHKNLKIDVTRLLKLNKDHMCLCLEFSLFCLVSGTSPTLLPLPCLPLFCRWKADRASPVTHVCVVMLYCFWSCAPCFGCILCLRNCLCTHYFVEVVNGIYRVYSAWHFDSEWAVVFFQCVYGMCMCNGFSTLLLRALYFLVEGGANQ